ncbi:MAG: DUF1579 domain-containing protein [Spartobacteria bacterium]
MKTLKLAILTTVATLSAAALVAPSFAQETEKKAAPAADMTDPEMMAKMMELTKLGENHKLLGEMAGVWTYTVKMWMDGNTSAEPMTSKGTATRKPMMGGRYYEFNAQGEMEMPGADGKMEKMDFKGMGLEGYDNVKKRFVSTWMDNMGTGIMMSEGTYDPATKTFTYASEIEMMPGMKTKVREVIKIVDNDHHTFEWYEDRGGKEMKTMEINYTRKK